MAPPVLRRRMFSTELQKLSPDNVRNPLVKSLNVLRSDAGSKFATPYFSIDKAFPLWSAGGRPTGLRIFDEADKNYLLA